MTTIDPAGSQTKDFRVGPGIVCRGCGSPTVHPVVDLGMSPPCESFLTVDQLDQMERFYPLRVLVCSQCFLMQLRAYLEPEEIFSEYAYFSSYSESWLAHAERFVATAVQRFNLGSNSWVVELASNDGYLLQYLVAREIPVTGIEPAANVARAAEAKGVPTVVQFFGQRLAGELATERRADLIVGNNVLAQVPDLDDFVGGMKTLLAPHGVLSIEFPHLVRLIEENQFDTIYHEHYSYFSFTTIDFLLRRHGLEPFDVEVLPTHGGSLRVFGQHSGGPQRASARMQGLLREEAAMGIETLEYYQRFAAAVEGTKRKLLRFLIDAKDKGQRIAGYGAPGKGNTLLNYCGIRSDLLEYTVDRNPYKHGRFLPGTHIPVYPPEHIRTTRPDLLLILPWNLEREITAQLGYIKEWGGRAIVPIPEVRVVL